MNTNPQTTTSPASSDAASSSTRLSARALKLVRCYQHLADLADNPDFIGWDILDSELYDGPKFGNLIQLWPEGENAVRCNNLRLEAARVARHFPGRWGRRDDGSWQVEVSDGPVKGLSVIIHQVVPEIVPKAPPADYVDPSSILADREAAQC